MRDIEPNNIFSQAGIELVTGMLANGESNESVRAQLTEKGMDTEQATWLLCLVYAKSLSDNLMELFAQGYSCDEVSDRLIAQGMEPDIASGAVSIVSEQFINTDEDEEETSGVETVVLRLFGGIAFCVGIILVYGNRSGEFPTFPFAGFITMSVGVALWKAGSPKTRRNNEKQ